VSNKQELLDRIAAHSARVGIIGLGYVGLPLAAEFASKGFSATGFEVDQRKADSINRGESYIIDVPTSQVAELVSSGRLRATTDFAQLRDQDIIIICVPTPLRKTKDPDVSYILAASEKIAETLRPGQLIILESTTYPGTTDEVLRPMFDAKGLELDRDYFLAFSPERVDPGNPQFNTHNIPKVVGGVTADSTDVAVATYGAIVANVHRVGSARAAEAAKLLENTFRAVNIGMVNELAQLCDTLGIDTWEVIEAAATKPFGFMAFYPGPGIGGHCLIGDETVVVRSADHGGERCETLAGIFFEQWMNDQVGKFEVENGGEVICQPRLDALSLDPETQQPKWRPISYLFRRRYDGNLVTITTSDNRRLTVTDEHPMLIVDETGRLQQVFAKDLKAGDQLPIRAASEQNSVAGSKAATLDDHFTESLSVSAGRRFKQAGLLMTAPVKSVEIKPAVQPLDVYSVEVEDTHTFATSWGIYVHNCIPLDPHYLSWKARMHGFEARFISLAEEVNSRMPEHVVDLVTRGLNRHRKPVNGSRVLILGVAYKSDIDDMRESPALAIIDKLQKLGALVSFHDPYVAEVHLENDTHDHLESIPLTEEVTRSSDCVVIVTNHRSVDYKWVAERASLIVDTRNATRSLRNDKLDAKIIRL
jgi:nucleotide sugar dehydrogenase